VAPTRDCLGAAHNEIKRCGQTQDPQRGEAKNICLIDRPKLAVWWKYDLYESSTSPENHIKQTPWLSIGETPGWLVPARLNRAFNQQCGAHRRAYLFACPAPPAPSSKPT
jgi:hypothetical protein